MGSPLKFLFIVLFVCALVITPQTGVEAQPEEGASAPTLEITELVKTTLPSVVDKPLHFKLLRTSLPAGQTAKYATADGMVFQVSGTLTITADDQTKKLQQGQGMYLGAGKQATFQAPCDAPAVFLHFILVPTADLGKAVEAEPASMTELFRTQEPLPGLKSGSYVFDLTHLKFPPKTPRNDPHYRTGGALYYVISGTGEFTASDKTEPKPAESVIYEPYGMVHQWGNPGGKPVTVVVANISPQGMPAFEFGAPPSQE